MEWFVISEFLNFQVLWSAVMSIDLINLFLSDLNVNFIVFLVVLVVRDRGEGDQFGQYG